MSAEEVDKSISSDTKLIEREPIEGTPFWRFTDLEKNQTNLIFGNYRMNETPIKGAEEEAIKYLIENTYNILLSMIIIVKELDTKSLISKPNNNGND